MHYAWERRELNEDPWRKTWGNERPESTEDNQSLLLADQCTQLYKT